MDGALQPAGAATVTLPFAIPPVAAVYVNVSVLPVDDAVTFVAGNVSVPEPSAAYTLMLGEDARFVSEPPEVDFAFACHVADPAVVEAVAPGPPPLVAPYVIVKVDPPATVSDDTVIV